MRGFLHQYLFYTLGEYFNSKAVVWYTLTTKLIFIIQSLVWNSEVYFHMYDALYIMLKMIL